VVLFDRSLYNRAGVERVMGYATEEQVETFLKVTPTLERAFIASGIILVKYWLEETMEDQTERFGSASTTTARSEAQPDGSGKPPPLVRLLARP